MEKYHWLNTNSRKFLERGYLSGDQTPEHRIKEIAKTAEDILKINGFASKFEDYMSRGFYSLSTPVWTNFGNDRGLPVSCFNSHIPDDMAGILYKNAEVGMMSKLGGGTSGYFGSLRERGSPIKGGLNGYSSGAVHFMEMFDTCCDIVSQGSARRGSFAAYLPIEHPDIEEFLQIREDGHPIQQMSIGITVTDDFMKRLMSREDKDAIRIWGKVIKKRFESGYPYIFFTDTVNNNAPQVYKDKDRKINASNLCSEICLSSNDDESFVCVLSSLNLLHWEDMFNTDAIETMIMFLDAVNEEFVQKTEGVQFMEHPHNFAKRQRALGMGVLGWHSLLQSKMIPFGNMEANLLNTRIWKTIRERADNATESLAKTLGEPEMLKGTGRRNVTTLAVAPTTSSSFILGQVSSGIEPIRDNYHTKDLAKIKASWKNPHLKEILKVRNENTKEIWKSILDHGGSVQHLKCLTDHEKEVFRTWGEISQKDIIVQASARQHFIDQSQSLNIMIPPETSAREVNQLIIYAWENGIKTMYYQRSANPAQELSRSILTCSSCEG
jgi:ribonucleoside-diphosphate reductase alpha chain